LHHVLSIDRPLVVDFVDYLPAFSLSFFPSFFYCLLFSSPVFVSLSYHKSALQQSYNHDSISLTCRHPELFAPQESDFHTIFAIHHSSPYQHFSALSGKPLPRRLAGH